MNKFLLLSLLFTACLTLKMKFGWQDAEVQTEVD
jgi:hypothetical protein